MNLLTTLCAWRHQHYPAASYPYGESCIAGWTIVLKPGNDALGGNRVLPSCRGISRRAGNAARLSDATI